MGAVGERSGSYMRGARVPYTWSARFALERPHTLDEVVLRKLGGMVTGFADPFWPVSGAVLGVGDARDRTRLVLGLDPSGRFGAPDHERCEQIAGAITEAFGWRRLPEELPDLRIILGRRVGYEGPEYTMQQTRELMAVCHCGQVALAEADLFSLRYVDDDLRAYHEPGVVVGASANSLPGLLQAADAMGQQRLVAEVTNIETQVYCQPDGR